MHVYVCMLIQSLDWRTVDISVSIIQNRSINRHRTICVQKYQYLFGCCKLHKEAILLLGMHVCTSDFKDTFHTDVRCKALCLYCIFVLIKTDLPLLKGPIVCLTFHVVLKCFLYLACIVIFFGISTAHLIGCHLH